VDTPAAYKELAPPPSATKESWKEAVPSDGAIRGKWWEAFHDPGLNALEERIDISNQNIAAASASFAAARALVREAKSQYYPMLTAGADITRSHPSAGQFGALLGPSGHALTLGTSTDHSLPVQASWEPDLWGQVRQAVRTNSAAAQVSAADLETVRLSAHAELAIDYYDLRGQDTLQRLLDDTTAAYREALDLVRTQYQAGLANEEAVAAAETQWESAEAQAANVGVLRARYEHAIALLVGQAPSTFSIHPEDLKPNPPEIPAGVPSLLLERRPDIAAAERQMVQANAQIGAAKTAFFPSLLLSASGGFGSTSFSDWLTWPSRFWSLGPSLTETLFDAGLRRATVQEHQAYYDQAVATYRQTVLTAFQQVEDNLAALRVLSEDIEKQTAAVRSAERNLRTAMTRYQAGLDPYLNVISAQTMLLGTRQVQVSFQVQQMEASVRLIEALGGGWDTSQIPTVKQLGAKSVQTSSADNR
jgi:NodT family efflux transporter outer membrane factor (OMF) lipoprotein